MHGTIPPEAMRFLTDHIVSVAQLELLLLLRSTPESSWSASDVARELRADRLWTEEQLKYLCQMELLAGVEGDSQSFRYSPQSAELASVVDLVSRAYLINRVTVIELIYSRSTEKIKAFAEAFRLRKDKENQDG